MASDPCALKRKYMSITDDDYFTICVSAITKCGTAVHQICNNRIFEYDILSTWEDVIKDIVDDEGFDLHKTDLIHVQLSKNSNAVDTESFKPDMKDFLRVVKNFNSSLKFVKFQIDRNENVGFNNNTSGCCSKERETGRTAFTVLMSGASAKKFPELNDVNNNSHRFTGLLFHCKFTDILFLFYCLRYYKYNIINISYPKMALQFIQLLNILF